MSEWEAGSRGVRSSEPEYDLWVNIGQSNSKGNSESPWKTVPDTLPQGTFYEWDGSQMREVGGEPSQSLGRGVLGFLNCNRAGDRGNGGYQNRLFRRLQNHSKNKLVLVNYSASASGIVPGVDYNGGNWSDEHLDSAQAAIDSAISWLSAQNWSFKLRGLFWQQGEADASGLHRQDYTDPADYSRALSVIIERLWNRYRQYYQPFGKGAFFNVLAHIGTYASAVGNQQFPSELFYRGWDIWNIHRTIHQLNPRARCVCYRGPWMDKRELCHDNVHLSMAGYNEFGDEAAQCLIEGNRVDAQMPPTDLEISHRTCFNVQVAWTNHAANPRTIVLWRRPISEGTGVWEIAGQAGIGKRDAVVGLPDPTASYRLRVSVWGDNGFDHSDTLEIPAFQGAPHSVPTKFFAAAGISGTSDAGCRIQAILKDLDAVGLRQYLFNFVIFRREYNASDGTTVRDIMGNRDWTVEGPIVRDLDHYATDGRTSSIKLCWGIPGTLIPSYVIFHKQQLAEPAFFHIGESKPPDENPVDENRDQLLLRITPMGTLKANAASSSANDHRFNALGGTNITSPAGQADGTIRSFMHTHRSGPDQDGRCVLYADGSSEPLAQSRQRRWGGSFMRMPENTMRIGQHDNRFATTRPSAVLIFARNWALSGADYAEVHRTVTKHLG